MLISSLSWAADPEFVGTETPPEEAAEAPESDLTSELGFAQASGNIEYWLVNAGLSGGHRWGANKVSLILGANTGRSRTDQNADGFLGPDDRAEPMQENARRYSGDLRYDRFIGDKNSLYLLGGAFVDPFAGYTLRSHEQFGYSRLLVDSETTTFRAELGADYAQEFYTEELDAENQRILAARLLLGLSHTFNDHVLFSDTVEVYENVMSPDDVRVLNTASLTAKLSDVFSLKVSHNIIFDNVPAGFDPETETYGDDELRRLDMVTTAAFVATLF